MDKFNMAMTENGIVWEQSQLDSLSFSVPARDERARQLGYLKGRVVKGLSSDNNPWQAKPNVYPNARATGTATAFPTCMYLYYR